MPKHIEKFSHASRERYRGRHRFEHWYVSNQVYFITARVRDRQPVFAAEPAAAIFWERFEHYTDQAGFIPWVTSLVGNHYHTLGYNANGPALKTMMQRLHGSVAKLVNDLLEVRITPFWRDPRGHDYFDGCVRDLKQARHAYRYVLLQGQRHGLVADDRDYPYTRVGVELRSALRHAMDAGAFMSDVPYPRYFGNRRQ